MLREALEVATETPPKYFWFRGCGWKKSTLEPHWTEPDIQVLEQIDKLLDEKFGPDYYEFVQLPRKNEGTKTKQVGIKDYEHFY